MDPTVILKFLGSVALPPASMPAGLLLAALIGLFGWRKLACTTAALSVIEAVILTLPPVGDLLVGPLEQEARQAAAQAPACCYPAIVVLGGGIRPAFPPLMPEPDLQPAADRLWHAARLYRQGVAPVIIVSGGDVIRKFGGHAASTEAGAMAQFLNDLGVPDSAIVRESHAINTRQNVEFVRALVQGKTVALVTSAYHMPRALQLAKRAGLDVAAFPTDWHIPPQARTYWETWLPTGDAQGTSAAALWEYMALAFDHRR